MTEELLLHIGFPKTGTTWLQNNLFVDQKVGFASPYRPVEIRRQLVDPGMLAFDAQATRAWFKPRLDAVRAEGYFPVISRERLAGNQLTGPNDNGELANRLRAVFPEAKVLMVIRRQEQMLYSAYRQRVKGLSISWSFRRCVTLDKSSADSNFLFFPLVNYEYDRLIRYYYQLFGKDRVLVLPYEQFQRAPHDFALAILAFCGRKTDRELIEHLPFTDYSNPSLSGISLVIKRRLNFLFGNPSCYNQSALFKHRRVNYAFTKALLYLDRVLPSSWKKAVEARQRQEVAQVVGHHYRASNRRTAQLTGLDLAAYGYDLDPDDQAPWELDPHKVDEHSLANYQISTSSE